MTDKKAEILEASRELFNRQGYLKTSLDDISQVVGMKKSSLYYYFKSKEELFIDAYKEEWTENLAKFQLEADKESQPDKKILSYTLASLSHYDKVVIKHNIPVKVIIETRNLFRQYLNEVNALRGSFLKKCIDEGIQSGIFKPCDSERIAQTLMLVKFSIQYDQYSLYMNKFPTEADFQRIKDQILFATRLILDGITVK